MWYTWIYKRRRYWELKEELLFLLLYYLIIYACYYFLLFYYLSISFFKINIGLFLIYVWKLEGMMYSEFVIDCFLGMNFKWWILKTRQLDLHFLRRDVTRGSLNIYGVFFAASQYCLNTFKAVNNHWIFLLLLLLLHEEYWRVLENSIVRK